MTVKLPLSVAKQVAEADAIIRTWRREKAKRGGRPRIITSKPLKFVGFISDTIEEIDFRIRLLERVVGQRTPGNKRRGPERMAFCADLISCFLELKHRGIKLPRGGSLSAKAFMFGVGEVLIRHGEMAEDDFVRTIKNSNRREALGRKHARLFNDVARAIEENPLQK